MTKPTAELIMVTFNTPELVQKSIVDIWEHTTYPEKHMTIIDNSSIDHTWQNIRDICYEYPGEIQAYQTHINKGYGTACNIGARLTKPDYYVFLNSDIHIHPDHNDWLDVLIQTLEDDEEVGVVAPKLINPQGNVVGHAVIGTNKDNDLSWYWMKPDSDEFNDKVEAVTLCGAVIVIPRTLFWDMGGFDERFFHYYEEKDLIYNLRKEGYKAICNPEAVMFHDHMGSCQDQNLLTTHEFNGRALFSVKHSDFIKDPKVYGR